MVEISGDIQAFPVAVYEKLEVLIQWRSTAG